MPLVMAVATGQLIRTGRGGLLLKSCAVFFLPRGAFSAKTCHSDAFGQLGQVDFVLCRSHVPLVQSKVCLLIKCLCLKDLKNMFDICAVCILCMVILSIISYHCKKLNISFSLVPVYAMLCAFPVENVEIIEPYPNIKPVRWPGVGRTVWTCRCTLFLRFQLPSRPSLQPALTTAGCARQGV